MIDSNPHATYVGFSVSEGRLSFDVNLCTDVKEPQQKLLDLLYIVVDRHLIPVIRGIIR